MSRADGGAILVLTAPDDGTADLVCAALVERVETVVRMDTADFPQRVGLAASPGSSMQRPSGYLNLGERRLELAAIHAVYDRRPARFRFAHGMSRPEARFAMAEAIQGFGGIFASLPCRWVDHPARVADASYKAPQLEVAARCGLQVTNTLITNIGAEVDEFARDVGGLIVYKAMSAGVLNEENRLKFISTTQLRSDELDYESIGLTACLFQEWIDKCHDVRLTVAGDQCFAVEIHAGSDAAHVDWRADYDALTYHPIGTPPEVQRGVQRYLHEFGLRFGAFDFSVDRAGCWWFLECNPTGQWGWLAEECGLPIAEAVADVLVGSATGECS